MKIPGPVKKALFEATVNGYRQGVEDYYQELIKHFPHSSFTFQMFDDEKKIVLDRVNSISEDMLFMM